MFEIFLIQLIGVLWELLHQLKIKVSVVLVGLLAQLVQLKVLIFSKLIEDLEFILNIYIYIYIFFFFFFLFFSIKHGTSVQLSEQV